MRKKKNSVGRPSKFYLVKDKIIEAIRKGNYYEPACKAAGVDYSTFRDWMKKAEEDKKGPFFQFSEEVHKAEAEAELEIVQIWKSQMPHNWQAARDFLARRQPERWASQNKVDVTTNGEQMNTPVYLPLKHSDE
jgi:transposase-like protein